MSWDYLNSMVGEEVRNVNLDDLATTIDLYNTLIRLRMAYINEQVCDVQDQLDMIRYRSFENINDTYGGKYGKKRSQSN